MAHMNVSDFRKTDSDMAKINTTVIIPHRGAAKERVDNLVMVANFWRKNLPSAEIIIIEQDKAPSDFSYIQNVNYMFVYNPGPFNRSWAFNVATKLARYDVVLCVDNDFLLPLQAIADGYHQCQVIGTSSPNHEKKFMDMSLESTRRALAIGTLPDTIDAQARPGCAYSSGALFMTKAVFQQIGGWEEDIRGWGAEDNELLTKMQKLGIGMCELDYPGFHLYHDRSITNQHSLHPNNVKIWKTTEAMDVKTLTERCKQKFPKIGNPDLYRHEPTD